MQTIFAFIFSIMGKSFRYEWFKKMIKNDWLLQNWFYWYILHSISAYDEVIAQQQIAQSVGGGGVKDIFYFFFENWIPLIRYLVFGQDNLTGQFVGQPASFQLNYVVKDGNLYIDPAEGRRWFDYLRAGPRVRVRFDGNVYPLTAVLVGRPGELEGFDEDRFVYRLDARPWVVSARRC